MKLLAFVDVHGNRKAIKRLIESVKIDNPDYLVCAGDLTNFSYDLEEIIKLLNTIKKPILIIPGNHEDGNELKSLCKKYHNLIYLHKNIYRINGYTFIGCGGGGFSFEDHEFEEFVKKFKSDIKKDDKIILITHAPIYGTKVDIIPGLGHRGCKSYRKFVDIFKPIIAVCGHFHETEGKFDELDKSLIVNPGQFGKIIEF